jgi:cytochrome P450
MTDRTILHDPVTFPSPDTFDPYRFLGPGSEERKEIVGIVWGWGRRQVALDSTCNAYLINVFDRACPGRQLAEATLFISIASFAAVFDISLAKDADGQEVPVSSDFTLGFVRSVYRLHRKHRHLICSANSRQPLPFKCSVTPRSPAALELIKSASADKSV